MWNELKAAVGRTVWPATRARLVKCLTGTRLGALGLACVLASTGCETGQSPAQGGNAPPRLTQLMLLAQATQEPAKGAPLTPLLPGITNALPTETLLLQEGDTVQVSFPGAPTLNTAQVIRRDGRVTLPLIGEFKAAGLSPRDMEKELLKLYAPQLQVKEVTVTLPSSGFAVYVIGAVLRPGKIVTAKPLTALEAVMEAGGFDFNKANLKSVNLLRQENGRTTKRTLNLKRALRGQESEPFKLQPADILYVPERFTWF